MDLLQTRETCNFSQVCSTDPSWSESHTYTSLEAVGSYTVVSLASYNRQLVLTGASWTSLPKDGKDGSWPLKGDCGGHQCGHTWCWGAMVGTQCQPACWVILHLLAARSTSWILWVPVPSPQLFSPEERTVFACVPAWEKCVIYGGIFWNAWFCRILPEHYLEIGQLKLECFLSLFYICFSSKSHQSGSNCSLLGVKMQNMLSGN